MTNVVLLGSDPTLQPLVNAFVARAPSPSGAEISTFLRMLPFSKWQAATESLIIAGVPSQSVEAGITLATQNTTSWIKDSLSMIAGATAAFHGIRRNDSLIMGGWWFLWGITFPIATNLVAVAQGFGKPKKKC